MPENVIEGKQEVKTDLKRKGTKSKRDKKDRKPDKRPFWKQLFVCLILVAFICCLITYNYIIKDFKKSALDTDVSIDREAAIAIRVPEGSTTDDIAGILKKEQLISNELFFKIISKFEGFDGQYKTGTHFLNKNMELGDIMKVLSNKPESLKVTFPEGFTVKKMAARLEKNGVVNAKEFIKAVNELDMSKDYPFVKNLKNRDVKLEGYLFPDTYEFDMMAENETIISTMLNRFNDLYQPEYYKQAEKIGLTMDEVIILASIVEKESKLPGERKKIAGVFYNRLKNAKEASLKKLQSCATLQYIIERDTGAIKEVITSEDEKINDIYNTYIHEGLPPGPICNPSIASIKAALNPEKHSYYYFSVKSDNSGEHYFAKTYTEHVANQGR
jgi:UPF0755 protein